MENVTKIIQDRLLHIAKIVCNILTKNNIPYSLAYGTLLGAVRHNGFIPWDDDFDLWLFDDSYEYALDCLRRELPDYLFVEDKLTEPKFFHAWARVKDTKSIVSNKLFIQDDIYSCKGLQLDLYKLIKIKLKDIKEYLINENTKYLKKRLSIGSLSEIEFDEKFEKYIMIVDNIELTGDLNRYVYCLINTYDCKFLEIKFFRCLINYKFADELFFIPKSYDNILCDIYGDYKKLPPDNKRSNHFDTIYFIK